MVLPLPSCYAMTISANKIVLGDFFHHFLDSAHVTLTFTHLKFFLSAHMIGIHDIPRKLAATVHARFFFQRSEQGAPYRARVTVGIGACLKSSYRDWQLWLYYWRYLNVHRRRQRTPLFLWLFFFFATKALP
jgi:hypothetical protein